MDEVCCHSDTELSFEGEAKSTDMLRDRQQAEERLLLRETGPKKEVGGPVREPVHDRESSIARSYGLHDTMPAAWMRRPLSIAFDRMASYYQHRFRSAKKK